jgi:hypothetical protein
MISGLSSETGIMPLSALRLTTGNTLQINLFSSLSDPHGILLVWIAFLIVSILFTIGLATRISGIILFLMFASFFNRNPLIMNGADIMMRCSLFLVIFSPCANSCSVDRLIAIVRGKDPGGDPEPVCLWTQRLMQVQIALVYAATVASKLGGQYWINGTAVYFPLHMDELKRFPLPALFDNLAVINLLTWGTIAVEASLATFIWYRKSRPYVLAAGVLLHTGIEYSLNIPMFAFVMISSYLNFVYNDWIVQWVAVLSNSLSKYKVNVLLPATAREASPWWLVVERLDILHLLHLAEEGSEACAVLTVEGNGWSATGLLALRRIVLHFPLIWPISPVLLIPGSTKLLSPFMPRPIAPISTSTRPLVNSL